jgi:hypothetical protein
MLRNIEESLKGKIDEDITNSMFTQDNSVEDEKVLEFY